MFEICIAGLNRQAGYATGDNRFILQRRFDAIIASFSS